MGLESNALKRQIGMYDAKRQSSADLLNEAMSQFGIPEMRSRVSGLRTTLTNTENSLNAVDPSVTGRTQGSLVTEAQRSKQVTNERAPIMEQYGSLSRSLGDAQDTLSEQDRAAQMLAEGRMNDYEAGRSALVDRYNIQLGKEQERRRQLESDRAFELDRKEAERLAKASSTSGSGGYSFGGGYTQPQTGGSKGSSGSQVNPTTQKAYNDVKNLLGKDSARIQREYEAIKKSAGYGNQYDKVKLQLIEQLYPSVKNYGKNTVSLGSSSPTVVPWNSSNNGGLSVGVANSGNIRVR